MNLSSLVWENGILFDTASDKSEALDNLVAVASSHPYVDDPIAFESGIRSREKIVSTGIGLGVAIPHAKLPSIKEFFLCVSILEKGVDWDSIDGEAVRIIFLIAGPDARQNDYLEILARLSFCIKDPVRRQALLNARRDDRVLAALEEA